jgi:N-acyl-D-aspartate/D-glutamate deacylase
MAERAGDVLFSGGIADGDQAMVDRWDEFLTSTNAEAGRITSVSMSRPSGFLMGLIQVPPVRGKAWAEVMALPTLEDRVDALRDAGTRAGLEDEGREKGLWFDPHMIYPMGIGEYPDYNVTDAVSLGQLAEQAGRHPIEIVIDRLIESEGRELYNVWFFNRSIDALGEFLHLDNVCPNLGDAGAHVGQICDADAPTFYLKHWHRDQQRVGLEDAIHRLSAKPAGVLGLDRRGVLAVGNYADINVFDPAALRTRYPTYVHDFPHGKGRFVVKSDGYAATIVNGQVVVENGTHTGSRPGTVIREFSRG